MQLVQELNEGIHLIRRVTADTVHVGDRLFSRSFLITPDRYLEEFPVRALADFDPAAIALVLGLEPALVLVGTGLKQELPSPPLMASFLRHGIGIEAMNSGAAARTFNLLAGEGRRVAAVFLL